MKLNEVNIIITGAGAGFGRAMSLYFISKGATIYALDINQNSLVDLKEKAGSKIHTFVCDVSNHLEVERTINEVFLLESEINVLINNAGIMKNSLLVNLINRKDSRHSIDLWNRVIQVNQNSVFYMTRSVADKMIRNRCKGVIINISSIAARGNAGQTAYAASKAAVEAMSKVWAKELGSFGIRAVSIAPGFVNTLGAHNALEEKMLKKWISQTPLRRTGEVAEIVRTVQFVIENDFFNGETININGGLNL